MKLKLLFSSDEDGTAIRTLYTRAECAEQTILAIKTTNNEVIYMFVNQLIIPSFFSIAGV